jgi:hypothetical protein
VQKEQSSRQNVVNGKSEREAVSDIALHLYRSWRASVALSLNFPPSFGQALLIALAVSHWIPITVAHVQSQIMLVFFGE